MNTTRTILLLSSLVLLPGCLTQQARHDTHPIPEEAPIAQASAPDELSAKTAEPLALPALPPADSVAPVTLPPVATAPEAVAIVIKPVKLNPAADSTPSVHVAEPAVTAVSEATAAVEEALEATAAENADLWERIRRGMTLGNHDHPGITPEVAWFAGHQAYLDRVADRAQPYMHFIVEEVERRGLPSELALLPVVESAYQPFAFSRGRAAGIWQFIPATGKRFGLKQTWWYDGRRDVAKATHAALDYLQLLQQEFDGDWLLALAAYNSGEGTVARAIQENRRKGKPTDFWSLNLPLETRGYVPKLLAISAIVANPAANGIALKSIDDQPVLTSVEVGSQIDLDLAAELAGITLEDIYRYNPAFNRWATDPEGPHTLLIPLGNAEQFKQRLAELPKERRIQWVRHQIRKGETLGAIASRYHTTAALIKSVNGLTRDKLKGGQTLVIPIARQDLARHRPSANVTPAPTPKQTAHPVAAKTEYVVKRGDTLWSIAKAHGVPVATLAEWNHMKAGDPLAAGKRLALRGVQAQQPQQEKHEDKAEPLAVGVTPATFKHPHKDSLQQRIGYTVRKGETLKTIARKFSVTAADIMRWNSLGKKKKVRPGQQLTIMVDITRQSGA